MKSRNALRGRTRLLGEHGDLRQRLRDDAQEHVVEIFAIRARLPLVDVAPPPGPKIRRKGSHSSKTCADRN